MQVQEWVLKWRRKSSLTEMMVMSTPHYQSWLGQLYCRQLNLQNVTVGKHLLPAVEYFLQVLLQVVAGTGVGMAAKREMVLEIHLLLQAVVGKD